MAGHFPRMAALTPASAPALTPASAPALNLAPALDAVAAWREGEPQPQQVCLAQVTAACQEARPSRGRLVSVGAMAPARAAPNREVIQGEALAWMDATPAAPHTSVVTSL